MKSIHLCLLTNQGYQIIDAIKTIVSKKKKNQDNNIISGMDNNKTKCEIDTSIMRIFRSCGI